MCLNVRSVLGKHLSCADIRFLPLAHRKRHFQVLCDIFDKMMEVFDLQGESVDSVTVTW